MTALTTGSLSGAGQFKPSNVGPFSCSILSTLHVGAPDEGYSYSSVILLLQAFASLAVKSCCQESNITGAGISPAPVISAHQGVVARAARVDLAC